MRRCRCYKDLTGGQIVRITYINGVPFCPACDGYLSPARGVDTLPDGLLSYSELLVLKEQEVITNITEDNVNSTSIDLTLGAKILWECTPFCDRVVDVVSRDPLNLNEHDLTAKPFLLHPGQFILAQSQQVFNLPNCISAEYKLKSSMARVGLEHLNAGWCDAGWNGSVLTLELKNMTQYNILKLTEGMPIGQVVFFKHTRVPEEKSYATRGRYNNDLTVKGVKL